MLPHNPDLSRADPRGAWMPRPRIQRLLAARAAQVPHPHVLPVLRVPPPEMKLDNHLLNYATTSPCRSGRGPPRASMGTALLLLAGPPDPKPGRLSWRLQFTLNAYYCVGRLDLDDTGSVTT